MKILFLILVAVTIYLAREITVLKLYISNIPKQDTQTTNNQPTSSPHPILWFWSSEVSPNGRYKATSYTGDYADRYHYYQVFITDLTNDRMHRIYTGDYRTLDWKWMEDNKIKISYNCGNACKSTRIIDVNDSVSMEFDKKDAWRLEHFVSDN